MPIISLDELKTKPVPITYGEVFSYSYFFENKTITIDIVNEHEFMINFIFEDEKGKRKYSYLDKSFAKSDYLESFKKGNYPKKHFNIDHGYILYNCIFSYLDEASLINVLDDFGYYSEVPCSNEYQKAVFVDNIYFFAASTHRDSKERKFSISTKTHNNSTFYDDQLRIDYIVSEDTVYKTIVKTEESLFPSIFNLLHYSERLNFHCDVNIFNDDFTYCFWPSHEFIMVKYCSGELNINSKTRFCEGNKTRDYDEIQRILTILVFYMVKDKPTSEFKALFKDMYGDNKISDMTIDEFKCLEMYQI
jgi:hypothetical protein